MAAWPNCSTTPRSPPPSTACPAGSATVTRSCAPRSCRASHRDHGGGPGGGDRRGARPPPRHRHPLAHADLPLLHPLRGRHHRLDRLAGMAGGRAVRDVGLAPATGSPSRPSRRPCGRRWPRAPARPGRTSPREIRADAGPRQRATHRRLRRVSGTASLLLVPLLARVTYACRIELAVRVLATTMARWPASRGTRTNRAAASAGRARADAGVGAHERARARGRLRGPRRRGQGRRDQAHHASTSTRASPASSRCPRRPSASARSGTSSATSRTCRLRARSCCSTAAGTTAPASSG